MKFKHTIDQNGHCERLNLKTVLRIAQSNNKWEKKKKDLGHDFRGPVLDKIRKWIRLKNFLHSLFLIYTISTIDRNLGTKY